MPTPSYFSHSVSVASLSELTSIFRIRSRSPAILFSRRPVANASLIVDAVQAVWAGSPACQEEPVTVSRTTSPTVPGTPARYPVSCVPGAGPPLDDGLATTPGAALAERPAALSALPAGAGSAATPTAFPGGSAPQPAAVSA